MSTNGVVAFQKEGALKTIYNHYDSYPSNLGNDVLDFIRRYLIEDLSKAFDCMIDKANFSSSFYDLDTFISHKNKSSFYYEDFTEFMQKSLFCEWAYLINLDTNELEIYKGHNKSKPIGRFRDVLPKDSYYPVTLIRVYNLVSLPSRMSLETLDVSYKEINIDLDEPVLNALKKEATTRKMSVESLIIEILQEELDKNK
jgi:hypothetical protein